MMTRTRFVYFDTSAWNALSDRSDQDELIRAFQRAGIQIFASVISAGEILRTSDLRRRATLCKVMKTGHEETPPILDHPDYLLRYAVEAIEKKDDSVLLRESAAAQQLAKCISGPETVTDEEWREVSDWILAIEADCRNVRVDVEAVRSLVGPRLCSPEVLEDVEFNTLMVRHLPIVQTLALDADRLMKLTHQSDIWNAFRASVAYELDLAYQGRGQPGGVDLRQAMYLGACDTFVLRDSRFENALREIATASGLFRDIFTADDFFAQFSTNGQGTALPGINRE